VFKLGFQRQDKILIKNLYHLKGYEETELMNEYPNKWTKVALIGC